MGNKASSPLPPLLHLQKFQSLEEEHLQQLLLFTVKYTSAFDYHHRKLQEVSHAEGQSNRHCCAALHVCSFTSTVPPPPSTPPLPFLQTHTNLCAKLNALPVESLITQFALKKATGTERPGKAPPDARWGIV